MKILLLGVGSIGERHVKNLVALNLDVSIYDVIYSKADELAHKYKVKAIESTIQSIDKEMHLFDLVLICTPTHTHVELAIKALEAGCNLFIEKPLAEKMSKQVTYLISLARNSDKITLVGCNMRFHPGVQEIKRMIDSGELGQIYSVRAHCGHYLPNWRSIDYTKTYSANADQGGGILLECIHEFDYLRWLFGEILEVSSKRLKSGALKIDGEDLAEVIFLFKNRIIASLHADSLQQTKRRGLEIIAEKGTFIWESRGKNPETATFTKLKRNGEPIEERSVIIDPEEMYIQEMNYLIRMIKSQNKTMNDIVYASETLQLVDEAKK